MSHISLLFFQGLGTSTKATTGISLDGSNITEDLQVQHLSSQIIYKIKKKLFFMRENIGNILKIIILQKCFRAFLKSPTKLQPLSLYLNTKYKQLY